MKMKQIMAFMLIVGTITIAITSSATAATISYYSPLPGIVYPAAHVYSAHSSSLLTPSQRQYHTQDEFGQYAYGYSEPLSAKEEVRSLDGTTRGSYSYRDAEGKLQMVAYTADNDGFHVAATNLPRAAIPNPQQQQQQQQQSNAASIIDSASSSVTGSGIDTDTVEVAAPRQANLATNEEAKLRLATGQSATIDNRSGLFSARSSNVRTVELPNPVEDTPAVAIAKAEHLKRFEQEKLRNQIIGARTILPAVYNLGYPLNTRLLATGYFY